MFNSKEDKYWTLAFTALLFVTFVIWITFGLYQSHYLIALRILGDTTTNTIIGTPKEGRGDEWSTYLPMFKQAYHESFSLFSTLRPYYERLDWFIAIPHANASLFFLPNQAFYWLIPPTAALSLQGFYYNALFLVSTVWFLSNIGAKRSIAIITAFSILFSEFFQMWWTSNFPALGACILPFAIFTSRVRDIYRFGLLFWSLGHLLFGEMYPPFYMSTAICLIPLTIACRPDLLTRRSLLFASLAAASAAGSYLLLNWDFVRQVANTSYPGKHSVSGGESSYKAVLSLFFPAMPDSSAPSLYAIYEFSMAGSILPLTALACMPIIQWSRSNLKLTVLVGMVSGALLIYMLAGLPDVLARFTGSYLGAGRRMHLGFSLLVNFYSAIILSRVEKFKLESFLVPALFFSITGFFFPPTKEMQTYFFCINYLPYVPLLALLTAYIFLAFAWKTEDHAIRAGIVMLTCAAAAQIVVYGAFNPLMRANDILKPVNSQFTADWRALYRKNNGRPLAIIGNYGHVLRGEGLPALEAIHLANVDLHAYETIFPTLSPREIDSLFNQFRGLAFANIDKMDKSGPTVRIPIEPFAVPFAHMISHDEFVTGNLTPRIELLSTSKSGLGSYDVRWQSVLVRPLGIEAPLTLHLDCLTGTSWLTRYPVVIPGQPPAEVALQGLAGRVTVYAEDENGARTCVSRLKLSSS
ncbi:DUF7657 domain-containing protein [Dyella choica]|uniref:DUF7657 domain-containing protein n=1 Tax=Dyella choica TaxID=1927959 RepID=A0A3S0RJ82_9GAMM|nr:hypothetical protein [Dyella choica]RUL73094.1 hypothetical protein EKH80_15640 [Dyella choica]